MADPNTHTGREDEDETKQDSTDASADTSGEGAAGTETATETPVDAATEVRDKVEANLDGVTELVEKDDVLKAVFLSKKPDAKVKKLRRLGFEVPSWKHLARCVDAILRNLGPNDERQATRELLQIGALLTYSIKTKDQLGAFSSQLGAMLTGRETPQLEENEEKDEEEKSKPKAPPKRGPDVPPAAEPDVDPLATPEPKVEPRTEPEPVKTSARAEVKDEGKKEGKDTAPDKPKAKTETPKELASRLYETLKDDKDFEDLRRMIRLIKADPEAARNGDKAGYEGALQGLFGTTDVKIIRDNLETHGEKTLVNFIRNGLSLISGQQLEGRNLLERLIIVLKPEERNDQYVSDVVRVMAQELRSLKVTDKAAAEPKVEPKVDEPKVEPKPVEPKPAEPKVDTGTTTPDIPDLDVPKVEPKTPAGPAPDATEDEPKPDEPQADEPDEPKEDTDTSAKPKEEDKPDEEAAEEAAKETDEASDEVTDEEKQQAKEKAEALLTDEEKMKLIDGLLKRLDQDVKGNSPAVEAIRELLMEKMTEKGLTEEDLKKLEAYLRVGKKLKDVDLFIGDRSLDDLKKEHEDNKRKLADLSDQLDDTKARAAQRKAVNVKEMTALNKRMAPLKKDYAVYKKMSDAERAGLGAGQRKRYEEMGAQLDSMQEEYSELAAYTGRDETDPIRKEIRELEERQSWLTAGIKKLENQEGEETQHYKEKPEKLLGTILTYFAEKEISGRGTPDYDAILSEIHDRIAAANEKQSGKFRKAWMFLNPLSYLKPTLTGTLQSLIESDKNLSKVKPEYIAELAKKWRNPEEVWTWIQQLEGISEQEAMKTVVPALIGHLRAAVNIGGNTYMNTFSIMQAKGLLHNLRQVAHKYSMEQVETKSLKGVDKMNAYFAHLNGINRTADKVGEDKVKWNMYKVMGRNLAIAGGTGALGWSVVTVGAPALALAGGLGIPTTALGVAAAPVGLTYGVGKWGVKDPALSEFLRRNAVRTLAAGGLGALAFGASPLLAGGLVAGGLFAPNVWKNRQAIMSGTGKGIGKGASLMGKGAGKAAPYAVKAGKGVGYVGARTAGLGLGLFGAGLFAGLPLLSERYRKFFGINLGRWDPLNRNVAHA